MIVMVCSGISVSIFINGQPKANIPDSYQTLLSVILPMIVLLFDLLSLAIIYYFISRLKNDKCFQMSDALEQYGKYHVIYLFVIYISSLAFYSYYLSYSLHIHQMTSETQVDQYLWVDHISNKSIRIIYFIIYPMVTNVLLIGYLLMTMFMLSWPYKSQCFYKFFTLSPLSSLSLLLQSLLPCSQEENEKEEEEEEKHKQYRLHHQTLSEPVHTRLGSTSTMSLSVSRSSEKRRKRAKMKKKKVFL